MKKKFYILSLMNSIFYFGVQSIIGLESSKLSGGNIFYYPIIIATFLLFTAIGIYFGSIIKKKKLKSIIYSEISLIVMGAFLLPVLYITYGYATNLLFSFYIMFSSIFSLISGISLYLITNMRKEKNTFFILDYLGSFISTIVLIFLLRHIASNFQIILLMNFLSIGIISCFTKKIKLLFFMNIMLIILSQIINNSLIKISMNSFGDIFIKNHITTSYQEVLLLENKNYYFGFLNNQIQFTVNKQSNLDDYHSKMKKTIENQKFKKVLILGGGDGLPSKIVYEIQSKAEITLIDIDKSWVEFSKTNAIMKKINNNSLEKTTLLYQDAFNLKNINDKFDLIIIDFPEGDDFSAYRVHSIEYFNKLSNLLSDQGIILSQEDFSHFNENISNLITNTAYKSNLYPVIIKESANHKKPIVQYIFAKNELLQSKFLSLNNAKKPIIYNHEYISNNQNNVLKYKLFDFFKGNNE